MMTAYEDAEEIMIDLAQQVWKDYQMDDYFPPNPHMERYLFKHGWKDLDDVGFFPPNDIY